MNEPTMPHPDQIKRAILDPVSKYLAAHPEVNAQRRCPKCSAQYPDGSLLCEQDGTALLQAPELQAVVRRCTNDIGIFIRKYGSISRGPPVEILWDEWVFDTRPWLARVHEIAIGKGVIEQTASVNSPAPRG